MPTGIVGDEANTQISRKLTLSLIIWNAHALLIELLYPTIQLYNPLVVVIPFPFVVMTSTRNGFVWVLKMELPERLVKPRTSQRESW